MKKQYVVLLLILVFIVLSSAFFRIKANDEWTVYLTLGGAHKAYVGVSSAEQTPDYATTEFSSSDYACVQYDDNVYVGTDAAGKWICQRFVFNLTNLDSNGYIVTNVTYKWDGHYYGNFYQLVVHRTPTVNNNWITDFTNSSNDNSGWEFQKTIEGIRVILSMENHLFSFAIEAYSPTGIDAEIYTDCVQLEVSYKRGYRQLFYGESIDGYLSKKATTSYSAALSSTPTASTTDYTMYIRNEFSYSYYRIDRGYVSFDTASIPDSANISCAILYLKVYDYATNGGNFTVKVYSGSWGDSLTATDWGCGTYYEGDLINTTNYVSEDIKEWYFGLYVYNINKTGRTQFELVHSMEGTVPTDYCQIRFYSTNSGKYPLLMVEYTANSAPEAPTLNSPIINARFNPSAEVQFAWHFNDVDVGDAQSAYQFQLDDNSDFTSPIIDTGKVITSNEYVTQILPSGVGIYYWRVKTWDGSDEEGEWSNGRAIIVDKIKVTSITVDDGRVDLGSTVHIAVELIYEYDGNSVESGSFTINGLNMTYINGSWKAQDVKNAVTMVTYNNVSGIDEIYGLSTVNMNGKSVSVIWDRLIVTLNANTTSPAPNSYVSFTVTAVYGYDYSPVSNWSVNILRNGTYFATGNFTDGGYVAEMYIYTTENVTENIYGLTAFTSNFVTVYWSSYVALTIQTKDLDGDILSDTLVYFNLTPIAVDKYGCASMSEINRYDNITVKISWHNVWVNGSWTVNMTDTQTIVVYCNVWNLLVVARDNESALFNSPNLALVWTFPETTETFGTSDGTWTFKTCNGTHYYKIKFYDVWVSANTSICVWDKNVTVLYVNCKAYPYTIASKYHWASNATFTSYVWNSTSLLLQIEFNDSPDNYVLVSDAPQPTYFLNVSFNMPTDYARYLCLKHYGNTTITVSYENWGDFYIRSVQHRLSNIYWTGQVLTIIVDGGTGENGTLTVYCGSRGSPRQASSLTSLIYNADTKILSGTYVFSSTVTVTLDWTSATGGLGGETTVGKLEITVEDTYLSLAKGDAATFNLTIYWTGVNDIVVTKVTVTEEYVAWFGLAEALPKYGSKTSAETEGVITVMLQISVPWQITIGQHTIPVTVTVTQQGGITVEKSGVIYLTITSGAPSPAGIPEIMTYLFLAAVIGLSSYAFVKKRY